jgi:putative CocE/NonD family hydrolase
MTHTISRPFEYSGFSEPQFDRYVRSSTYVEMSDGAKIAADLYLPDGYVGPGEAPTEFPVIVNFMPYLRALIDPVTGKAVPHILSRPGEQCGDYHKYGYALVIADTRTHGASTGPAALVFGWRYQQDAGELIDWIDRQDWCDGNVGMVGGSHHGWTQLAAASQKPKALKAIMPAVVPLDGFTGQFFVGGIFMQSFVAGVRRSDIIEADYAERAKHVVAPVDGSDIDPNMLEQGREEDAVDFFDWENKPFIDTLAPSGESGRDFCANLVLNIPDSGVAIYNMGGWFDGFARGTTELFATLCKTNPSRMVMFPGYHDLVRGFMYDEFGAEVPDIFAERHRFFDRYLKGIPNGIENDPPVLIYNMQGDGWRQEREWPLAREQRQTFSLASGYHLGSPCDEDGADTYTVDLSHDRRYGTNLSSRWMGLGSIPPAGAPDMTDKDKESLCYTSSPLTENLEVTGHPIARLWVSSTAEAGDIYVYLEDVDQTGRSLMVTEGQLRSEWADLQNPNDMVDGDLDILPKLPWHGYEEAQFREGIFRNDAIVELVIDLQPNILDVQEGPFYPTGHCWCQLP